MTEPEVLSPLAALKAARALLADESNWVTDYYAQDASGMPVSPNDPTAVCWCTVGALLHVYGANYTNSGTSPTVPEEFEDALTLLNKAFPGRHAISFNDAADTTHDKLLAAFDKAIAMNEVTP